MKLKRLISSIVALALVLSMSAPALAAKWYLEDGDITVAADENAQTVKQGDNDAVEDNDIVITQRDSQTATDSTITISTEGDAEANITIKDINIDSGANSAIDVGESNLNLTVEGENTLTADGDSAALRVSSGDLTIDGDGSLNARHDGREGLEQDSAKIGSNAGEDMTGNIHITGDVTVTTGGTNSVTIKDDPDKDYRQISSGGAGIGAGAAFVGTGENGVYSEGGDMSGTITIDGNAKVDASSGSELGAGIGTGGAFLWKDNYNIIHTGGEMSGTISIGGNADVSASSELDGAGIGTGYEGNMTGDIAIGDSAKVSASSGAYGAGIGTGCYGDMSGDITIDDSAKVSAVSDVSGAGIGTGYNGDMSGDIAIDGNAKVSAISDVRGAGIGTGSDGEFTEDAVVTVGGDAEVLAFSGSYREDDTGRMCGDGAGIGAGDDAGMYGTVNIWGNAKVTAVSGRDGSGIGCGDDGSMGGTVNITDNANVNAVGGRNASGIGAADEASFYGKIIISGNANVVARAGSSNTDDDGNIIDPYPLAAAIGGVDDSFLSSGRIMILGNAKVTTGMIEKNSATRENPMGTLVGSLKGYIGNEHYDSYGLVFISDTASVNGVSGADREGVNAYINGGNGTDLIPAQVEVLPDGTTKLIIEREGYTVSDTLYGGSTELPTAPGTYPITATVTIGEKSFDVVLGTIVIPEPEPEPEPGQETEQEAETGVSAPLYRVTDRDGRDIAHEAERKGGVLTITVDADFAILTGKLSGIDALKQQGIEKIVFVTNKATSTFKTASLLEKGDSEYTYKLTHNGNTVTFAVGEKKTDVSGILIKL